eukprot:3466911-Rhodomonas_salina.1
MAFPTQQSAHNQGGSGTGSNPPMMILGIRCTVGPHDERKAQNDKLDRRIGQWVALRRGWF